MFHHSQLLLAVSTPKTTSLDLRLTIFPVQSLFNLYTNFDLINLTPAGVRNTRQHPLF
jgi:hypothetical protein